MTATLSAVNESKAFAYYKYKIKRNRKIGIILLILNMVGFPLLYLAGMLSKSISGDVNANYSTVTMFAFIAFLALGAAIGGGIFVVFMTFDYLFNKSLVDMTYSTPLTTAKRFWMDFAAGLTVYLVPFITGGIIGSILCAINQYGVGAAFHAIFPLEKLLPLLLAAILGMIMLYAMTLLVCVCCGSLFESVAYTVVINGIIPGVILVTYYAVFNKLYGMNTMTEMLGLICKLSPVGVVIGQLADILDGDTGMITDLNYLIPILLTIAFYIAVSFWLYAKRKAESCGKPFVFKLLYYVLITAVVYSVVGLLTNSTSNLLFAFGGKYKYDQSLNSTTIIASLICSAIVYLVLEVITNRGFKGFWKSAVRYGVTYISVILVLATLIGTECFGLPYLVPSADSVKSVDLSYPGQYSVFDSLYVNPYNRYNMYHSAITFTEKESIQAINDMHKTQVEDYKKAVEEYAQNKGDPFANERVDNYYYMTNISLEYHLNTGLKIIRQYNIESNGRSKLKPLDVSLEFKQAKCAELDDMKAHAGTNVTIRNNMGTNALTLIKGSRPDYGVKEAKAYYDIVLADLVEALKKDILAETYDQYYTPDAAPLGKICFDDINNPESYANSESDYSSGIFIKAHYANTIAYLKAHGIDEYLATNLDGVLDDGTYNYFLMEPTTTQDEVQTVAPFNANINQYLGKHTKRLAVDSSTASDKVRELLKVAQPMYMADENCYTLINGKYGVSCIIPPEYAALAKEVFDSEYAIETKENEEYQVDYQKVYGDGGVYAESYTKSSEAVTVAPAE